MQANSANQPKQIQVYGAFTQLKQEGKLRSLQDAEKLLSVFGVNTSDRNVIKFDVEGSQGIQKECLYEYNIPHGNNTFTTFYVDQNLGFECGERLIDPYKDTIRYLHLTDGRFENQTTHTIH